ncbi:MAG: hypothetical protein JXM73_09015, partial [Anaerolineae bacterium]|nr:hypothetical protein [Anaerolineae bacterium]
VDGYIKRHPEVREAWIDARETMVDMAESKLHAAVERGVWRAIRYTLSTLGRDRGYSTKPLPEQKILDDSDGGAFWEAMRKAYGDKRPDLRSDPPSNDIDDSPSGEVEKE